MKLAFVGHSYHKKTGSSAFIIELLALQSNKMDFFYDESWNGGSPVDTEAVVNGDYDRIVVWQMTNVVERLAQVIMTDKIIFFPMYDACYKLGAGYWGKLKNTTIISFSSTLFTKLKRFKSNVYYVKYFPNPEDFASIELSEQLDVFYWQRRQEPSLDNICKLIPNADSVHWHRSFDPGFVKNALSAAQAEERFDHASVSEWFESVEDLNTLLSSKNIYIAPRDCEGIGMSFLEAMARGQCVIALNNPTMSEYIVNGVDGILLDDYASPLDLQLEDVLSIGREARRTMTHGYKDWRDYGIKEVENIIFSKNNSVSDNFLNECSVREINRVGVHNPPLISVAVVCFNVENDLRQTLNSIVNQQFNNFELVVIDGGSTDGTIEIIKEYSSDISFYISEQDAGPYDAMNKAARHAKGEWIIYINAGDHFYSPCALKSIADEVEDGFDFILGGHIYRNNGIDLFNKVADFEFTWNSLNRGSFSNRWKQGIPCHQSTLTKRDLIVKNEYELSYKIAADHSFLYRMKLGGARFKSINRYVSVYYGGGLSAKNVSRCIDEWIEIAKVYAPGDKVDAFYLPKMPAYDSDSFMFKMKAYIKALMYKVRDRIK